MISSTSPSVKIQIIGGKVCLRCKGKTLLGIVNKLFVFKICWQHPANFCLWIFTEGEGDGIESRVSPWIFFTLTIFQNLHLFSSTVCRNATAMEFHNQSQNSSIFSADLLFCDWLNERWSIVFVALAFRLLYQSMIVQKLDVFDFTKL